MLCAISYTRNQGFSVWSLLLPGRKYTLYYNCTWQKIKDNIISSINAFSIRLLLFLSSFHQNVYAYFVYFTLPFVFFKSRNCCYGNSTFVHNLKRANLQLGTKGKRALEFHPNSTSSFSINIRLSVAFSLL